MAGFTPSKTSTEFAAAAGAPPAALGPRKRAKKQVGYGLIYSDDEIEPIVPKPLPSQLAAMKAAAAANGSTTSTNTTSTSTTTSTTSTSTRTTTAALNTPRNEEAPVGHVHGSGIKKLVFEKKKKYTEEELYGRQATTTTTTKRATSSTTADNKKARSSRMSPYDGHSPAERKTSNYSTDEEATPVAAKKGKSTMGGALDTPKQVRQRRASPKAPPRTPQQPQQRQEQPAPAPTTPAATPAPAARLRSLWKAATSFLASPVSKAAGLVRDMDEETSPTPPSEAAAPEKEEQEQEHRWPGSFRKTPEPEAPPAQEFINPDMAKDPYAYAAFSPRPATFGVLYKKAQEKAAKRYTVSQDGKHRYWGTVQRNLIRNQEQSEVITVPDGSKRARSSYKLTGKTPEQQKAILEEIEREIEYNRRERRVSRRLDLEKRRVALAQMGVDWAEVEEKEREEREEMGESTEEDTDTESRRLRKAKKGKEKEGAKISEPSAESTEAPPTEQTPTRSQPTSFLFGGGSYKAPEGPVAPVSAPAAPAPAPAPAPAAAPAAPAAPASPTRTRSPPRVPSPTKVTKKKASPKRSPPPSARSPAPPATPTLSHATLPNPVAPSGSALLPPPPPPPTAASQQKAVSGLGFADPAHKARSQAEKFKPHVSSGLRASTTVQADSPPRAAPGLEFKPFFQPPRPTSAPVPPPTKKVASAFPLKTKKLGPNGKPIVEVNQVYLDKFLEAIARGKSGDEKILAAVKGVWREPPVEETKPVYQLFLNVLGNTCPPI